MRIDALTRLMLAVATACLVLLVIEAFGLMQGPAAEPAAANDGDARFMISAARGVSGPILVRLDTRTGQVWTTTLRDPIGWVALQDAPPGAVSAAPEPDAGELVGGQRVRMRPRAARAPVVEAEDEGSEAAVPDAGVSTPRDGSSP